MSEKVIMNFYNIDKCGYYDETSKEHLFGNKDKILMQLKKWSRGNGMTLSDTCTFQNNDGEEKLRVFCFDISRNTQTKDFVLTTWNETPSYRGKVSSVSADKPVGEAIVHQNKIAKGTIPGYATYFWFISELNVFATLKFQNTFNGHQNLVKYMSGFLERHSDHTVIKKEDDENAIIEGYRESEEDETQQLTPMFRTKLLRKEGEINYIHQNYKQIRKVIKKSLIDLEIEDEVSFIEMMGRFLGTQPKFNNEENIQIKYSLPFRPTQKSISDIIKKANEDGLSFKNDVGFQFKRSQKIVWLSNSIIRYDYEFEIDRVNEEIVNITSLHKNLKSIRNAVIDNINNLHE